MIHISPNSDSSSVIDSSDKLNSPSQVIARAVRHRRRMRMLRFLGFEAVAVAVFVLSVIAGISGRFAAESLTPIFRTLPILAAAVAAILPIFFFGDPKRKGPFR
jgi:hypothetical protein